MCGVLEPAHGPGAVDDARAHELRSGRYGATLTRAGSDVDRLEPDDADVRDGGWRPAREDMCVPFVPAGRGSG